MQAKTFKRILITLVSLIAVGYVGWLVYSNYQSNYGLYEWYSQYISSNVTAHYFNDDTYRVYNESTKRYTTSKIDWVIQDYSDTTATTAVYATHNKRGYIDLETGQVIIDADKNNYSRAWIFSEGLAAVVKDDKIGFINTGNEVVIPFQYDFYEASRWDVEFVFHSGYCPMTGNDGKVGVIDKTGAWVVEPQYDEVRDLNDMGYRIVVKEDKYGVIDALGNEVYPTEYLYITIFDDGVEFTKPGKMWKEDFEGNIITPFMYAHSDYLSYPIEYDGNYEIVSSLSDYMSYCVAGSYGIMSRITGKPITPAIYSNINMISYNLFEVQDEESCEYYIIDSNGNKVPTE